MSLYAIKPRFQSGLRPLVAYLARHGVSANQLTVVALLLSVVTGALIALWPTANWPLLLLPPCLPIRMALNAMDGMLAREHKQASHLGALLNELGDVIADAALYLPLALVPHIPSVAVVGFVFLGMLSEFAGVLGPSVGAGRQYQGPMGKADRALLIGALALVLGLGVPGGIWVGILLGLGSALLLVTIVRRLQAILQEAAP